MLARVLSTSLWVTVLTAPHFGLLCPGISTGVTAPETGTGAARAPGSNCLAPKLAVWEQIQLLEGTTGLEGTVTSNA